MRISSYPHELGIGKDFSNQAQQTLIKRFPKPARLKLRISDHRETTLRK